MGLIGWIGPSLWNQYNIGDYHVKELKLEYPEGIVDPISLYKPIGKGPFPGIVFGSGAGADKALYKNWAEGFVSQGFVVLLRSSSYGRKKEKPWIDSRDDMISSFQYLKKLDYVDKDKIIIGGHSASANLAYWVGYKIPKKIKGIVAIAGRFPPEEKGNLNLAVFLGTGKNDKLVPPEKLYEVANKISESEIKKNKEHEDITIYVSDNSNHLKESWDNNLIREAVKWSTQIVGLNYKENYSLEKINIKYIILKIISAFLFFIGIVIIMQYYLKKLFHINKFIEFISIIFYFGLFYYIWSATISKYLFYFGPFPYNISKYIVTALIVAIIGIITYVFLNNKSYNKFYFDLLYLLITVLIITYVYSFIVYIPAFNYGGSLIFFKILIVTLPIIILGFFFKKIHLLLYQRIIFYDLVFVWLLTAVMPLK